ncbi:hypothetical protein XMD509_001185 [Marinobacterium sp. xm-d-509]|nr:hypothetical protein [Marinobacterium sp. xm-g-48]NRP82921.1 hypothetical protein [Marinobacterium sp. xm-d-509]
MILTVDFKNNKVQKVKDDDLMKFLNGVFNVDPKELETREMKSRKKIMGSIYKVT